METVHRESHGLVPNEIIPVSEDASVSSSEWFAIPRTSPR
jgi:hypothetical protein